MNKEYNDVELTTEEVESLNDPILTDISTDNAGTTESQEQETTIEEPADEAVKESNVVVDDFKGVEIDGKAYDVDTIKSWMDDANNKSEWQKSNTEKAQELSKWNKFTERVNKDDEFRKHIKDFFYDNPDEINKLGLDGNIGLDIEDAKDTETPSELERRLEALEQFEHDRIMESRIGTLDENLTALEEKFPEYLGENEQVQKFLTFAESNAERFVVDGLPSLDAAFKEWSYDQMQQELSHYKKLGENSNRNKGKIINKSEVGAKEVKSPKKILSWKDATMDDPEIAKYFEE